MNLWFAIAAMILWLGLGLVFLSMCRVASRADEEMEQVVGGLRKRTLRQHLFAVHVRSLRTVRRHIGARGNFARSGTARAHMTRESSNLRSA